MITIIAGSRNIWDYNKVKAAVKNSGFDIDTVVSGTAGGVDRLGERWAKDNDIDVKRFPAEWGKYGKRAGYLRNKKMAEIADALVAIWDGKSKGTKHMINIAEEKGLKVYIEKV